MNRHTRDVLVVGLLAAAVTLQLATLVYVAQTYDRVNDVLRWVEAGEDPAP